MRGYILETLTVSGWRRGGVIYWTRADALRAGRKLIHRKLARRTRVLPAKIEFSETSSEGGCHD
jgi:hypothetical protein